MPRKSSSHRIDTAASGSLPSKSSSKHLEPSIDEASDGDGPSSHYGYKPHNGISHTYAWTDGDEGTKVTRVPSRRPKKERAISPEKPHVTSKVKGSALSRPSASAKKGKHAKMAPAQHPAAKHTRPQKATKARVSDISRVIIISLFL